MKIVPKMAVPKRDIIESQENPWTIDKVIKKLTKPSKTPPTICELIGENDVIRPFYDWDYIVKEDEDFESMKTEVWDDVVMDDLRKLRIDKDNVVFAERHGWCPKHKANKISYRAYVKNMKTTCRNLRLYYKIAQKEEMGLQYDKSVYNNNKHINMVNCCKGKYKVDDGEFVNDERILTLKTDHLDAGAEQPTIEDTFIQYIPNPDDCKSLMTEDIDEAERRFVVQYEDSSKQIELNAQMSKLHTPSNIKPLLDLIDIKYIDEYDDWFRLGAAIYNTGWENAYEIFDHLSMRSDRYGGVRELWSNMRKQPLTKITLGTIHHYAKLSNPEEYERIWGKMKPKKQEESELTLQEVVMALSPTRMDDPDDREYIWCVIYNVSKESKTWKAGKKLIHDVAKRSPNYNEEDVDDFLENIKKKVEDRGDLNIANLSSRLYVDNPEIFKRLVKELGVCDDPDNVKGYDEVKQEFEKEVFKIRTTAEFGYNKCDNLYTMKKTDLSVAFEELTYRYWNTISMGSMEGEMEIKTKDFLPKWFKDLNKRMYETIDFRPPPLDCPDNIYNMWDGFAIEKVDVEATNCDRILELVKVVCNHNTEAFEYTLDFFAQMIQYPASPPGVCLLFRSEPGAGKNTLIEILKKIMGARLVGETANPKEDIFGTHGNVHIGKILTNFDETENGDTCKTMGQLKNLITAPTCNYNEKNMRIKPVRNCNRFIMTTNKDIPLTIVDGDKDRRFVPIECSNEWCKNAEFWDGYYKTVVNDMGNIKAFYEFLMDRDVSRRNWMEFPKTELRQDLIKVSQHPIYEFFEDVLCHEDYISQHKITISPTDLFKMYQDFCADRHFKCNGNALGFGMIFKNKIKFEQAGIEKPRSKKERHYIINKYMAFEWLVKNGYNIRDELPGPKFVPV